MYQLAIGGLKPPFSRRKEGKTLDTIITKNEDEDEQEEKRRSSLTNDLPILKLNDQ